MPKERRRTSHHASSAKIQSRQFAASQSSVFSLPPSLVEQQHLEGKPVRELSGNVVLTALSTQERLSNTQMTKKERQQLKRDALLTRLESNRTPYSKSHARRLKQKKKHALVADLTEMKQILDTMDGEEDQMQPNPSMHHIISTQTSRVAGSDFKSSSHHLTTRKRNRLLKTEQARQRIITADPNFTENPFDAIRSQLSSTLGGNTNKEPQKHMHMH